MATNGLTMKYVTTNQWNEQSICN